MFVLITNRSRLYPEYNTHTFYSFTSLPDEELVKVKYIYVEATLVTLQLRKLGEVIERFGILQVDSIPKDPNNCMYLKLPYSGKVVTIDALTEDEIRRLGFSSIDAVKDAIQRMDKIRSKMDARRLQARSTDNLIHSMINEYLKLGGTVKHTRPFTRGSETVLNPKTYLTDPRPVNYFANKQELADYLVSELPEGVEVRKRNALRFKICVEMNEEDLVTLAASKLAQKNLLAKYQ